MPDTSNSTPMGIIWSCCRLCGFNTYNCRSFNVYMSIRTMLDQTQLCLQMYSRESSIRCRMASLIYPTSLKRQIPVGSIRRGDCSSPHSTYREAGRWSSAVTSPEETENSRPTPALHRFATPHCDHTFENDLFNFRQTPTR